MFVSIVAKKKRKMKEAMAETLGYGLSVFCDEGREMAD